MFEFIDRLINQIDGLSTYNRDYTDSLATTEAKLLTVLDTPQRILFAGNATSSKMQKVFDDLVGLLNQHNYGIIVSNDFREVKAVTQVFLGGSINIDPVTILQLKYCDSVILIEERNKSRFEDIDQSIRTIELTQKKILGFILL